MLCLVDCFCRAAPLGYYHQCDPHTSSDQRLGFTALILVRASLRFTRQASAREFSFWQCLAADARCRLRTLASRAPVRVLPASHECVCIVGLSATMLAVHLGLCMVVFRPFEGLERTSLGACASQPLYDRGTSVICFFPISAARVLAKGARVFREL